MDPDRWERVKKLFEAALPLERAARSDFVHRDCGDDESVRREVMSLLAAHDDAGGFMQREGESASGPAPSEPSLTFSEGQLIADRFRVLRFISHGGMGEVYEADDLELNERVALKTVRPKIGNDPRTLLRFKQEIQLARRVAHPNVCRMHDVERHQPESGRNPEVLFLTMELLDGETLADRLTWQGRMTCEQALPIVRQLAEALSAAHEAGVLHCDFKPSNVMLVGGKGPDLGPDGATEGKPPSGSDRLPSTQSYGLRAVVTDFGLARALGPTLTRNSAERSGRGNGWEGTLPYMAPEQLEGGEVDPATDVYALGLVMYEMVTGRRPFPQTATWEDACKRLRELPPSPRIHAPDLDPRWESAILRCLEISPGVRFQSAREVLQALEPPPKPRANALVSVVMLAVLLTGVAAGGLRDRPPELQQASAIKSLAVLPLDNLSGNSDQDYFAYGMTQELVTNLAKISALTVIPRDSVAQYRGPQRDKKLFDIARALNVYAVVEGTVMRSGDKVRIAAQLIDARKDGRIFWAGSYDGDLRDVLTLQSEVARTVAEEIQIKLTSQAQALLAVNRAINTQAYENYLRGRYEWNKGEWQHARDYFERAIQIDPGYAPPYSGLADFYWAVDELAPSEAMPEAKKYALQALKLDPNLAEAHTSLGAVQFYADWNWAEAERNFKIATQLDPGNADAHRMYSAYLSWMGRTDSALEESRKAESLDPVFYIGARVTVGWVLYYARRYDQALGQCREVLGLEPDSPRAHDCLGETYLALKRYGEAIAESRKAAELSPDDLSITVGLARAYARSGDKAAARKILAELRERSQQSYVPQSFIAQIYLALDERDQGVAWLRKAYAARDVYLARLRLEPAFDPVRSDPRFQDLIAHLNFPQ